METKQNCWDILNCGRQENGSRASELGICPACTDIEADGLNGGKNGGRICWAISGTFCGGERQGTFAQKKTTCMSCKVYLTVQKEEGIANFKLMKPGQHYQAA